MSFSRVMRPWLPIIFIIVIAILILFTAINYNTSGKRTNSKHGKKLPSQEEQQKNGEFKKPKKKKDGPLVANDKWRKVLPWVGNHGRFLPNYFTYHSILNASEKQIYRRGNIVYIHVPKSGGTTMAKCLSFMIKKLKRYAQFYGPIGENGLEKVMTRVNERNDSKLSIFSGEYAFKMCDRFDKTPCSYFLMLREPYDRLISSYRFCKRHSEDGNNYFCALNANNLTIVEWALLQGSFFFRQLIMHDDVCKGRYDDQFDFKRIIDIKANVVKGDFPCWMKLQAIIDNTLTEEEQEGLLKYLSDSLEQWFAGVGILERMDETLQMLDMVYGLPVHPTCTNIHANKAPPFKNKNDGVLSTKQYLKQLKSDPRVEMALKPDRILYKRVEQIVKAQKEARKKILNGKLV